ncbi:MAG TPA: hypothetical protein VM243_09190 [Phycisphaerae bacterium]|nr:hypothetical protein [Phycisphaerae bacterium]
MQVTKLTYIGFEVNALIDAGARVRIGEIRHQIRARSVFEFFETQFCDTIDLGVIEADERRALSEQWEDMESAIPSRKKFGVVREGLCLLQAFILEGIQREMTCYST